MADQSHDDWVSALTLDELESVLSAHGVVSVAVKFLPTKQDNDKNQIYLGMDLSGAASFLPSTNLRGSHTSSRKPGAPGKTLFQADVNFRWLTQTASVHAPNAKLIFYPQYPEVRLSGLIRGAPEAPRTFYVKNLRAQVPGRVLVLGVNAEGAISGLIVPPSAPAAESFRLMGSQLQQYGVLRLWRIRGQQALSVDGIRAELHGVHLRDWVPGCRLTRTGIVPYYARPAGGATLEAQLGVVTNSETTPDFQGWELKQHSGSVLTLFTSEPDGGLYRDDFRSFMRRYGVDNGSRHNFTGIQRVGAGPHKRNGLRLELVGHDPNGEHDPDGKVLLVEKSGEVAAEWSFLKLLDHWRAKHARVAFVPSQADPVRKAYRFGNEILLAQGASFNKLLAGIAAGLVYYDPACRVTFQTDGRAVDMKKRNQWRVHLRDIRTLYGEGFVTDVTGIAADNTISQRLLDELGVILPTFDS